MLCCCDGAFLQGIPGPRKERERGGKGGGEKIPHLSSDGSVWNPASGGEI